MPGQKGRVPGSGKNTKRKMVDGLPSRQYSVNRRGAEGPKKSMPAKKRTLRKEGPGLAPGFRRTKKK